MITLCIILYVLIGYIVAIAAYIAERQLVSIHYIDTTKALLCGLFWPLTMIAVSVVHLGEKINSKI